MEDVWLFKEGLKWVQSQKDGLARMQGFMSCLRERLAVFADHHGPIFWNRCSDIGRFLLFLMVYWKDSVLRGIGSLFELGSGALFVIIWSCFLSLTSTSCLMYVVSLLGASGATVRYLGYTPGLFIVGLFGVLMLSIYGNLWITGLLSIISGYLFSLNHARLVVFMSTAYAVYCVKVRVGLLGVFLALNLAFLSNDVLNFVCQEYESATDASTSDDNETCPHVEEFSYDSEYCAQADETEKVSSCKASCKMSTLSQPVEIQKEVPASKVVETDTCSLDEIKRILDSKNHYQALGLPRGCNVDLALLRREYRKKAVLVHPDKNMGIPLASESFKRLQSAYEVLSDTVKRKNYEEQLRKEESRESITPEQSYGSFQPAGVDYRSEESRRIHCTKCGNFHIWVCTSRSKSKARWCQDCQQHHEARDGDGWVELCGTSVVLLQKMDIPRAYACAESKIFDVSEWAICQRMFCKPNTHRPTFHVNMVGLEKKVQRSKSSDCRFSWDLDAQMTYDKGDEEFDVWLQQALAAGLFSDLTETSSRRRRTWASFLINQKRFKKQWRGGV